MTPRILAFSGSLRRESWNQKLVTIAAEAARKAGAEVTLLALRDLGLPLYDGDLEAEHGVPAEAMKLKELFKSHHGLLLGCPENNGSITAALKNAIDWVSRPVPDEQPLECFRGKTAGLMAASPGALGGVRGLPHVRTILSGIGVLVIPEQRAVGGIDKRMTADGRLTETADQEAVAKIGRTVAETIAKLRA